MKCNRPSLDEIGLRHGTDKASWHHDYLSFYERYLRELRDSAVSILEIGVLHGQSVAMWEEYFPRGYVVGLDINPATKQHETERVRVEIADQSNAADLVRVAGIYGPFDLILDDGSHIWDHQITTLRSLFPFVKPGGYYILEDIDTSYGANAALFKRGSKVSTAQYLHKVCDYMIADQMLNVADETDAFIRVYARRLQFIAFSRRTSLIRFRG
jgi:SAM-dependent methyltransferase